MLTLGYILTAVAAYLLGSIPTGFLVAKARGIDIRTVGSGNIGATNVFRVAGKGLGLFVFFMDAVKGYVACEVIGGLASRWFGGTSSAAVHEFFPILAGFVAVLGHNYPCWLGFKGGKGIATSAGALLALFPYALLAVLGIWILIFAVGRFVSLASIAAAFWLPIFVAWFYHLNPRLIAVAVIMAVLAIYKHRSNIERLIAGTEHRFGEKNPESADAGAPPT